MNRRQAMMLSAMALTSRVGSAQAPQRPRPQDADAPPGSPPTILLKDHRPVSIYKVPVTEIKKAKHPVVDVHCHGPRPIAQLAEWVKTMDAAGVEKTVVFTGASTPERFAEAAKSYQKYPGRFNLWCGFDFAGFDQPGFGPNAMKSLEACHRAGALGVGELVDKGRGFGVRGASPGMLRSAAARLLRLRIRRSWVRTLMTRAWMRSSRDAANSACSSMFMFPIRSGVSADGPDQ